MGSGKSSIGRRLAARLELPLIDLDDYIVDKTGNSVANIFAQFGEAEFRKIETEALREIIDRDAVIATGGGVVGSSENRALLKKNPPVIWLKASPEFLAQRIDGDAKRPLIAAGDTLAKLRQLAHIRHPLYQACADYCLPREHMTKTEATDAIMRFLSAWKKPR